VNKKEAKNFMTLAGGVETATTSIIYGGVRLDERIVYLERENEAVSQYFGPGFRWDGGDVQGRLGAE
jgi:hypothetical protein